MEDQGQKLKEILNNRKSFHTAYLVRCSDQFVYQDKHNLPPPFLSPFSLFPLLPSFPPAFNNFYSYFLPSPPPLFLPPSFLPQTLGEMVIGAFKHAGRRRMAFRVGTMMAQFHRLVTLGQTGMSSLNWRSSEKTYLRALLIAGIYFSDFSK